MERSNLFLLRLHGLLRYSVVLIFVFSILILSACQPQDPMYLESLEMYNKLDSSMTKSGIRYSKRDYYLVKNYIDKEGVDLKVDSLICQVIDPNYKEYKQYSIELYRESHMTNREKLLENDRILDRYSIKNDYIYYYEWYGGFIDAFIRKKKEGGQSVEARERQFNCGE